MKSILLLDDSQQLYRRHAESYDFALSHDAPFLLDAWSL
jgi:hypothetical protein